jgi:hypothetical protein
MGLDTKTYWLTDRQSQCDFDFDFDLLAASIQERRDPRTAPRQDNRGPKLIVARKIVITTSTVGNKPV